DLGVVVACVGVGGRGGGGGRKDDAGAQGVFRGGCAQGNDSLPAGCEGVSHARQFGGGAGNGRGLAVPVRRSRDGEVGQGGVQGEAHAGESGVVGAVVDDGDGVVEGGADDGGQLDGLGHHFQVGEVQGTQPHQQQAGVVV